MFPCSFSREEAEVNGSAKGADGLVLALSITPGAPFRRSTGCVGSERPRPTFEALLNVFETEYPSCLKLFLILFFQALIKTFSTSFGILTIYLLCLPSFPSSEGTGLGRKGIFYHPEKSGW